MRIWRYRLRKMFSLSGSEIVDLLRAWRALVVASILLRIVPRGRLLNGGAAAGGADSSPDPDAAAYARRMALAVSRVAEHGPLYRPRCLVRAVALDRLLRGAGIEDGRIRVGVRLGGGEFEAHAWVELGGAVLGDEEWHVRTFTPVTDMQLVRP